MSPGCTAASRRRGGERNLRELTGQIESPIFLARIRAATGTPIEQTNCHPFRRGRWLFMHNGFIDDYHRLRRDLLLAVDPSFFGGIEGTTDSELMLHLALSWGLEEEPLRALERMAGFVEATGRRHGVDHPLQMTVAASDGERLYAARYASGPVVNSPYVTADASAVRELHPEDPRFHGFSDDARAIVSEPLGTCPASGRRSRPALPGRPARGVRPVPVHATFTGQLGGEPPPLGGRRLFGRYHAAVSGPGRSLMVARGCEGGRAGVGAAGVSTCPEAAS